MLRLKVFFVVSCVAVAAELRQFGTNVLEWTRGALRWSCEVLFVVEEAMMHSAVCSSVSVGVTRPPVEGPALLWGCCCCNARRAHHHAREYQQQQQQLWLHRPAAAAAGGFGKLLSKKLDDEDTARLLILRKTMGLDRPRVSWMMPTTRAAAGGGGESLFLAASAETSEEGINLNESISRSENGRGEPRFKLGAAAMPSGGGGADQSKNLVHVLHETARVLQSALEEQKALTRGSWFAQKWLGFDKNAWMKSLAYQASPCTPYLLDLLLLGTLRSIYVWT